MTVQFVTTKAQRDRVRTGELESVFEEVRKQ